MAKQITRKQIMDKPVIKVGACSLWAVLKYFDRIGYMAGAYGWNCDVYRFSEAYIITGYRMSGKGIHANYDLVDELNRTAIAELENNYEMPREEKKARALSLILVLFSETL